MDFLQQFYVGDLLHSISSWLLIPTVVILVLLVVFSIYCIGSTVAEWVSERRRYQAYLPEFIAELDAADPADVPDVIDKSRLLRSQKDDLEELNAYLYLPHDARTEVAKRLLANQEARFSRMLGRTDVAAKVAPMLGLMGTLIPLGPGIVALGTGDVETLSQSLLVAFDTTVAGLATAVVCYFISRLRRRWYEDYLVSMEGALNTLLEKADMLHAAGYPFPKGSWHYDKMGRTAHFVEGAAADGEGGAADAEGGESDGD